jgi:hypothetical protein
MHIGCAAFRMIDWHWLCLQCAVLTSRIGRTLREAPISKEINLAQDDE